jgi:D-alanyl-D-alanine carboxypeptidase
MFKLKAALAALLILAVTPTSASATLNPQEIPSVFEKLLGTPTLSNPAMIVIDGSTGQTIYEKNIYAQRKPASVLSVYDRSKYCPRSKYCLYQRFT